MVPSHLALPQLDCAVLSMRTPRGSRRFMPSQQEVRWSQLKVGVIVLVSVVILTTLLFLMTSTSGMGFFSHKLTVTTYFENSAGLKVGAAVNLEGVTIGM